MNDYIISSNSLNHDIRCSRAEDALNLTVTLALRFKENIMMFQGSEKEKVIAIVRGHEIRG